MTALLNPPEHVLRCMQALEQAGHRVYLVGGCVRDALLGLTPQDYDLCTDATPERMQQVFREQPLVLAGTKHGTVGVITGGEVVEITTFRAEGGYSDNRHPDWVRFVTDLREDLARRDFTVNAIAWHPRLGLADPFGGREDLQHRVLRAVGEPRQRFREDALRILRGLRFSARYGLTPEEETLAAMHSRRGGMESLARERVFSELCKLLPLVSAEELVRWGSILAAVIPELEPMLGFDQHNPHHAYDLFTHTAHVVEAVPREPALRWAALLHDVGKVTTFTLDEQGIGHFLGHAAAGAEAADAILRRLKAPNALREQAVTLIAHHMTPLEPDSRLLRRRVRQLGWDTTEALLALQQADMGSKGTGCDEDGHRFPEIRRLLEQLKQEQACLCLKDLAVNGKDLLALGFPPGPALGQCLNALLTRVVDGQLPNDRAALLEAAKASLPQ